MVAQSCDPSTGRQRQADHLLSPFLQHPSSQIHLQPPSEPSCTLPRAGRQFNGENFPVWMLPPAPQTSSKGVSISKDCLRCHGPFKTDFYNQSHSTYHHWGAEAGGSLTEFKATLTVSKKFQV